MGLKGSRYNENGNKDEKELFLDHYWKWCYVLNVGTSKLMSMRRSKIIKMESGLNAVVCV